jgi:hypothetical protein
VILGPKFVETAIDAHAIPQVLNLNRGANRDAFSKSQDVLKTRCALESQCLFESLCIPKLLCLVAVRPTDGYRRAFQRHAALLVES